MSASEEINLPDIVNLMELPEVRETIANSCKSRHQ